ncbi:divalent-cation tolerance protein CutA [Amycolatopsis antarctica]|uniref:Divalent-cation tolerance protein CutA n=1 Tax=Amycolatopsis antarctica TaxID=1854586 RepID=A0A263D2L7_9PSEU|nr:divalent-cation tolerance protein CutA [Amycolatopsis antarctica]OZM72318.1 divalent-cation tolerance protein CutA [Amycolatopsis antarctica]
MSVDQIIVTSTTGSEEVAGRLATGAIEAGLAACAQVSGPITSVFRWEDEVRTEREWRVELKTAGDRLRPLIEFLEGEHTYEVPEIIATPITGGSAAYLAWLVSETR